MNNKKQEMEKERWYPESKVKNLIFKAFRRGRMYGKQEKSQIGAPTIGIRPGELKEIYKVTDELLDEHIWKGDNHE